MKIDDYWLKESVTTSSPATTREAVKCCKNVKTFDSNNSTQKSVRWSWSGGVTC